MNRNIKGVLGQLIVFFFSLASCVPKGSCCSCITSNENVISKFEQKDFKAYLIQRDDGAFGLSGELRICNTMDSLGETIGLRVEDVSLKVDSVIGRDVYIRYNYRRNSKKAEVEKLNFESVVLGDALINKQALKYSYHFYNLE